MFEEPPLGMTQLSKYLCELFVSATMLTTIVVNMKTDLMLEHISISIVYLSARVWGKVFRVFITMEALRLLAVLLGISLAFSASPEENIGDRDLFEGDIMLLPEQKFAIDNGLDLGPVDAFGASTTMRWPNGIVPYIIASSLSSVAGVPELITNAMKEWSTKTCIRFVQRTTQYYYLEFYKGPGCMSLVGMLGDRQKISLGGLCWQHGIAVHEIGHALGFWHEQSRPDRDNYVTVVWENILTGSRHNFKKYTNTQINSLNIPYDYESIMHYGKRAFSINGRDTIVPKQSGVTIGQRLGLSSSDAKQMNLMYNCQRGTPSPPKPVSTFPPRPTAPSGRSCGVSGSSTHVIGGTNAAPGAWPWQIAILGSFTGRFSCGGSLIYDDWIVTAAHCIRSNIGSTYTILLGAHNRDSPQSHEQKIKGKRVIVHPQYGRPRLSNDIALIQLEKPARLSNRVSTVCLPTHDYALPLSSTCYITGWGKIKHPSTSHHTLQQAKLSPVDQQECKRKLAASSNSNKLSITDQMLCAGVKDTVRSGCHGDSGGPYVCRDASNRFVLQGVVSWGSPICSASERYTVFARVAKFRSWIDQEIKKALG